MRIAAYYLKIDCQTIDDFKNNNETRLITETTYLKKILSDHYNELFSFSINRCICVNTPIENQLLNEALVGVEIFSKNNDANFIA